MANILIGSLPGRVDRHRAAAARARPPRCARARRACCSAPRSASLTKAGVDIPALVDRRRARCAVGARRLRHRRAARARPAERGHGMPHDPLRARPTCSALEAEAIHIMREVAAELERPVLLFSGGKDSIVLLRLAEKAFRPGALPVPGHARRHRPQLPRGDRVPRPPRGRARRAADRRLGAGLDRHRPRRRGDRPARLAQPPADRRRCSTRSPSTASTPPSAARAATRSGPAPRSASSPSATTSASGTPRPSAPSCGTSTTGASARASTCASSRSRNWTELDVWQYIARGGPRGAVDLLRPRARGLRARRDALRASRRTSSSSTARSPSARRVRYRTVGDMTLHRRRRARPPPRSRTSSPRSPRPRITERGETRADDRVSEAAMEDRKREGYF